jgi:hypothetical protein
MNFVHSSLTVGAWRASAFFCGGSPPRRTWASHSCAIATVPVRRSAPRTVLGGLAALASVRPVLEHEHLATRRGNLAQEAGDQRVPEFDGLCLGLRRIDSGLSEFDLSHDDSLERPGFQGPDRSQAVGSQVKFRKAPAYVELA